MEFAADICDGRVAGHVPFACPRKHRASAVHASATYTSRRVADMRVEWTTSAVGFGTGLAKAPRERGS
jgi:hypothetical protein